MKTDNGRNAVNTKNIKKKQMIKRKRLLRRLRECNYMVVLGIAVVILMPFVCFKLADKHTKNLPASESLKQTEVTTVQPVTEPVTSPPEYVMKTSDKSYFDDALFIGDSRTVGIESFSMLQNATYFAAEGMNVYHIAEDSIKVKGYGNITLPKLLDSKKFGKVYIMLGLNEIGYRFDSVMKEYKKTVDLVRKKQPDALIYIEANQHVTAKESGRDPEVTNERIDKLNSLMKELADGKKSFYIDVNEFFDDESGALGAKYTYDGVHVMANYYNDWAKWLLTKTYVKASPKK